MRRLLLVSFLAVAVGGCGDCPPSRVRPAEPDRTETRSYEMREDGTLELTVQGSTRPIEAWCDDACHQVFADPEVRCDSACAMLSGFDDVQSCAFDASHAALDCVIHHEAHAAACNCDIFDC